MGLRVGDVVGLIGGGPDMTVVVMEGEEAWARCYWFERHTLHAESFPTDALRLRRPREEGVPDGG